MNSTKCQCQVQDEQCFPYLLAPLIHCVKEFSITFTNFPHSLIGILSVVINATDENLVITTNDCCDYKSIKSFNILQHQGSDLWGQGGVHSNIHPNYFLLSSRH